MSGANDVSKESLSKAVSYCMLNNTSIFTAFAVIIGMGFGIKRKSFNPLILGGFLGSVGDFVYGYHYSCREIIQDYNAAKKNAKC